MRKIYYLKTCSTCLRILKALPQLETFELHDIKTQPIPVNQLEEMKNRAGSYQALFSKRATLYKEMGLKNEILSEPDYKHYILEHYTFLSRPVVLIDDTIFIGNSPKTVASLYQYLR